VKMGSKTVKCGTGGRVWLEYRGRFTTVAGLELKEVGLTLLFLMLGVCLKV